VTPEQVTTDILGCARCGQDHMILEFKKFKILPIIIEKVIYDYWGFCPMTGDPIIMSVNFDLTVAPMSGEIQNGH
jgi:hypothetical protein